METGSASTKWSDVYNQMQAKYGEKPEKPREIKKALGKDDFLNIMISQMQNQDPTNPFKAEQMASQIAQFTSVEQLQNVNQNLSRIAEKNQGVERMAMTQFIGKTVVVDKSRFHHLEGQVDYYKLPLPRAATKVELHILDASGEEIYVRPLGSQPSGDLSFSWDGIQKNTLPAREGDYFMRIDALDEQGRRMEIQSVQKSKVIGLSFEGQVPVFLLGDAEHQEKVAFQNLIRIEEATLESPGPQKMEPKKIQTEEKKSILKKQEMKPILPSIFTGLEGGFPNGLEAGHEEENARSLQ